jgi:hypothetical protein
MKRGKFMCLIGKNMCLVGEIMCLIVNRKTRFVSGLWEALNQTSMKSEAHRVDGKI